MRLANTEKAGYFPLPESVGQTLAHYYHAPAGGRVYDPCVGCGKALAYQAKLHQLEPYGVELESQRAEEANTVIQQLMNDWQTEEIYPASKRIAQGNFRAMKVPKGSFNLLYVNPPYMFSSEEDKEDKKWGRDEYLWLQETRPLLQPGGLYIWVVPQHMLLHNKSVRYISAWFEDVRVYRFPDPEYDQFRQIVLFGVLKQRKGSPNPDVIEQLREHGRIGKQLQILNTPEEPPYTLPPIAVPPENMIFRNVVIKPEEAIAEAARVGVATTDEYAIHMTAEANNQRKLRPLTPMKKGHLVSIIAAGLLNGTVLEDGAERLMIKGQAYKIVVPTERVEQYEGGSTVTITKTEKVVTRITTLSEDGDVNEISGDALNAFLSKWIDILTRKVVDDFPPLYNFDLNGYGAIIKHLNPHRKIPRIGKPGLLPAQAHAAAAAATRLKAHDDAYIIGEMGTGKTLMGASVAALTAALYALNGGQKSKHFLVMCPPHLVKKWGREIQHVWPAAKVSTLKSISDVDRFFAADGPIFGVIKETSTRQATGWAHAYDACGPVISKQRTNKQPVQNLRNSIFWLSARQINELKGTTVELEALKNYRNSRGICCPTCGERPEVNGTPMASSDFTKKQYYCQTCGHALYQDTRRGDGESLTGGSFADYVMHGEMGVGDKPENEGYARFPIATYINKKHKGKIDLLIVDEMHQFKGADSDRGYAYHRLCSASKKVLGLTGTLYGGKASTLFYLLYRSSAKIRQHFTNMAASGTRRMQWKKWVSSYGILQEIEVNHLDENGKASGESKRNVRSKELPGGSPAMLPWILESSVFVSLPDMGFALPGYKEVPHLIEMDWDQRGQYNAFERTLKEALAKRLKNRDKSLLGAYVQSLLTLPDSPWRNKGVSTKNGKPVAFAEALPAEILYPKEREILELIKEKIGKGEKVLLLCQQTNTLDITPRWTSLLEKEGLKSAVLRVAPDRREAWIKKQVKEGIEVLITHPKRVETGLDLLEFPTIIWMGTEYSIYTILQASRRSWRIGQEHDVEVHFFVYADTMQETALGLIASKLGAAARINGDMLPDEGLSEFDESTGSDLVSTLTNMLVEELDDLNRDEVMKQINEAHELAKEGNVMAYANTPFSFADCKNKDEIKRRYRMLARKYHPDAKASSEAETADKLETLNDLFQKANVAFQEGEQRMGEFDGELLEGGEGMLQLDCADDETDAVIRRLLLGEEKRESVTDFARRTAKPSNHMPLAIDYDKPAPVGTAVAVAQELSICQEPGICTKGETKATPFDYAALDRIPTLARNRKELRRPDFLQNEDGMFVGVGRSYGWRENGVSIEVTAYRVDFSANHPELVNNPVGDEVKEVMGKDHGRVFRCQGVYYVLMGPPVLFQAEKVERATQAREPEPAARPPEKLVFGVHNAYGQVRQNGLDEVAVQQLGLFG